MKDTRCTNCGTERFNIQTRKLCKRCYAVVRKIEKFEKWDPNGKKLPKGYPRGFPCTPDDIARMKADIINQCEDRMKQLRLAEERLQGPVSSMDIEGQLKILAVKAGAKNARGIMHGAGICFDGFTAEQRATVFYWLYLIEENIPRQHDILWSRYMCK